MSDLKIFGKIFLDIFNGLILAIGSVAAILIVGSLATIAIAIIGIILIAMTISATALFSVMGALCFLIGYPISSGRIAKALRRKFKSEESTPVSLSVSGTHRHHIL